MKLRAAWPRFARANGTAGNWRLARARGGGGGGGGGGAGGRGGRRRSRELPPGRATQVGRVILTFAGCFLAIEHNCRLRDLRAARAIAGAHLLARPRRQEHEQHGGGAIVHSAARRAVAVCRRWRDGRVVVVVRKQLDARLLAEVAAAGGLLLSAANCSRRHDSDSHLFSVCLSVCVFVSARLEFASSSGCSEFSRRVPTALLRAGQQQQHLNLSLSLSLSPDAQVVGGGARRRFFRVASCVRLGRPAGRFGCSAAALPLLLWPLVCRRRHSLLLLLCWQASLRGSACLVCSRRRLQRQLGLVCEGKARARN